MQCMNAASTFTSVALYGSNCRRTSSNLDFVTPLKSDGCSPSAIVMKIDGSDNIFRSIDTFVYVDDPVIKTIDSFTAIVR